ncbi:MAG TPA: hypothetical protein VF510_09705 [Ktedonobacterales bacterium]
MGTVENKVHTETHVGRRALLGLAATAGICGLGAVAAPQIKQEIDTLEREALLRELGQLEGIPIDAAIAAAELTQAAVKLIVLPLARLLAFIGGNALNILIGSLDNARAIATGLHITIPWLNELRALFVSWRDNVEQLPIALTAITTADISSAETYLKALKQHITTAQQAGS